MIIYRATNAITGKAYIGVTSKKRDARWRAHVIAAKTMKRTGALQGAIRKYGADAFVLETLYEAVDEREAKAVERGLIAAYGTMWPNGYNMSTGGELRTGFRMSRATRKKMRETALGREIAPSQRAIASSNMKTLWTDPQYRDLQKAARDTEKFKAAMERNKKDIADRRRGMVGFFSGKKHSEESKARMSCASKGRPAWNKGRKATSEERAKLYTANEHRRGRKNPEHSAKLKKHFAEHPELIERQRVTMLERWADPAARERMLTPRPSRLGTKASDTARANISAALKISRGTPEWRAIASARAKAQWLGPEKRARGIEGAKRKGVTMREKNLRKKESEKFGSATAAVRAMVRQLSDEIVPRRAA